MSDNERDPLEEPPPATQVSNPSDRNYVNVFLFKYDVDTEHPFSCYSLDYFKGSDFPFEVINSHMDLTDRLKPRQLSSLPGSKYCLFAKCEQGIFTIVVMHFHFFNSFLYLYIFIRLSIF